jgi:hypothetical protein
MSGSPHGVRKTSLGFDGVCRATGDWLATFEDDWARPITRVEAANTRVTMMGTEGDVTACPFISSPL